MRNSSILLLSIISCSLGSFKAQGTEKDLYDFLWLDPDKQVYVLQNKVHKKENTFYANIGAGLGLSSTFQDTSLVHGNIGYSLTEEWAIEAFYTNYNNKDNEALENLRRLNGSIPFIRKVKNNYGAMTRWSPFYGKINTFNKIFYFDWSFGVGLAKLNSESNAANVATPTSANIYKSESYTSIVGKTELILHASKNIHINLGVILNNYKAPGPSINGAAKEKIRNNMDALLSVGFSF